MFGTEYNATLALHCMHLFSSKLMKDLEKDPHNKFFVSLHGDKTYNILFVGTPRK